MSGFSQKVAVSTRQIGSDPNPGQHVVADVALSTEYITHLVFKAILLVTHFMAPQANSSASSILDMVVADYRPVPSACDACCSRHARYTFFTIARMAHPVFDKCTLNYCTAVVSRHLFNRPVLESSRLRVLNLLGVTEVDVPFRVAMAPQIRQQNGRGKVSSPQVSTDDLIILLLYTAVVTSGCQR